VERLQAYKFELCPDGAQHRLMRRFSGSCRYVYNRALALQCERHERGEKKLGYAGLCKELTAWRNDRQTSWLADTHSQVLQQVLKDLEQAYANFFAKRAGFPRFKKKGLRDSFRFPQGTQLDQADSRIFLPKIGWMRYRNSRHVPGEVCHVTVSFGAGKWFASIQTAREAAQPVPQSSSAVGIDMGVARFATLSDGTVYEPLNSFKRHQRRLAHYQRMMSRRCKFGRNWHKARRKVQKIHARIGNCRRDYLHKISTAVSKNHAMVCIEDLQVRNMSKSASGTAANPGTRVRAKSGLNRSILDQGVVRVSPPVGLQAGMERRHPRPRAAAQYQPGMSRMRPRRSGKSADPRTIPLPRVWILRERRSGRRHQCPGAGTPRCSLWRYFACPRGIGPGTHRSESA
jgi:putative transposase